MQVEGTMANIRSIGDVLDSNFINGSTSHQGLCLTDNTVPRIPALALSARQAIRLITSG